MLLVSATAISLFLARPAHPNELKSNLAPLTRQLDKMGRDFCTSFKLKCHPPVHHALKATQPHSPAKSAQQHPTVETAKPASVISTTADTSPSNTGKAKTETASKSIIPI